MAAFGNLFQIAQEPLLKELLKYVMRDESRHVAFGVLSLRDYYDDMPANELADREDFIIYASELMRDRLDRQRLRARDGLERRGGAEGGARVGGRPDLPQHAVPAHRAEPEEARPAHAEGPRRLHAARA